MALIQVNHEGKINQVQVSSGSNLDPNSFKVLTNGVFYTLLYTGSDVTDFRVTSFSAALEPQVKLADGRVQLHFVNTNKKDLVRASFSAEIKVDGVVSYQDEVSLSSSKDQSPTSSNSDTPSNDPPSSPQAQPLTNSPPTTLPPSSPQAQPPAQPPATPSGQDQTSKGEKLRGLFRNRV